MRGDTFGVVGKTAHLNPGTGLALIRLCKHAHFTNTARGRSYNSPHLIVLRCGRHLWCCGQNCPLEPRARAILYWLRKILLKMKRRLLISNRYFLENYYFIITKCIFVSLVAVSICDFTYMEHPCFSINIVLYFN